MKKKTEKKKTAVIIIAVFICLTMVLSIMSAMIGNQPEEIKYGKYKFVVVTDTTGLSAYRTRIGDKYYDFQYHPTQLERINISADISKKLAEAKGLVFLFNPEESNDDLLYIDNERYRMSNMFTIPIGFGIINTSEKYQLNVITCQNATVEVPFVMFNVSLNTGFSLEENCIIMNGRLSEITAISERLEYKLMGIMN